MFFEVMFVLERLAAFFALVGPQICCGLIIVAIIVVMIVIIIIMVMILVVVSTKVVMIIVGIVDVVAVVGDGDGVVIIVGMMMMMTNIASCKLIAVDGADAASAAYAYSNAAMELLLF